MTQPDGPAALTPSATLGCPQCRATLTYYDVTGSYYYGCPNCQTYFKYEDEGPPEIIRMLKVPRSAPVVPLGAEGYLFGQWVRMVGFTIKRETNTPYEWREYYLLLADGTYRSLSEYDAHWTLSEPADAEFTVWSSQGDKLRLNEQTGSKGAYVSGNDGRYKLFNKYGIELVSAVGEFDYNLLDEARLTVLEFVRPPRMLIAEIDAPTTTWYKAKYVEPTELETAFGLVSGTLPGPTSVGAIQPNPVDRRWNPTLRVWALGAVAALVIHLFAAIIKPHPARLVDQEFAIELGPGGVGEARTTVRTAAFQVNGPAHVGVDYVTNLDNHWAEFDADLVNQKTGQTYSFTKAVEYYHGTDDGEAWREGDQVEDASLSRIPSGRYFLTVKPYTDAASLTLRVQAHAGAAPFSNVLVWIMLTGLYPLFVWLRGSWYERDRWNQSDYNPNETE